MSIDVFTGEFLRHPAALELTANTCRNACAYCFATAHGKEHKGSIKSALNFLIKKDRKSLKDRLFADGYPILVSNRSDPFSKNNVAFTESCFTN